MRSASATPSGASILVVDDQPANLRLLTDTLHLRGYQVRPVPSGELALRAAAADRPDLILLDIDMPGMDGYEVCSRLKADPQLAAIPVIFVSAFDGVLNKVKGFGLGAVDYVTKPFDFKEVEARVATHLELARLRRELEHHNAHLEETVALRTQELAEAHARLAILDQAKGDFLRLISHEIRTPLCGVLGTAEMLLETFAKHPEAAGYQEVYEHSRRRLMTLVDDVQLLSEIGAGVATSARQRRPLEILLADARSRAAPFACSRKVDIMPVPLAPTLVLGSPEHLTRALQSLLETAVKFSREGTLLRLSSIATPGEVTLLIEAEGRDIPAAVLPRFFDLLAVVEPITPGGDLGLAPALAERIVSLFGGSVFVESMLPPGIRLTVVLKTP